MAGLLPDTMLLSLLVVGTASPHYITKHKRLLDFNPRDFDLLIDNVTRASRVIVTPNTLTETGNWVKMIGEPARSHVAESFRYLIGTFEEKYVRSADAARFPEFPRLWLTDAAILHVLADGDVLLTTDSKLFAAASRRGFAAVNFHHLRQRPVMRPSARRRRSMSGR